MAALGAFDGLKLSDAAIDMIRAGRPVVFTQEDAEEAGLRLGEEHIVLVEGQIYRAYSSVQGEDQIVVDFVPVPKGETVRTGSTVLDFLYERGLLGKDVTLSDTSDPAKLYHILKQSELWLSTNYQHTESGNQVSGLLRRMKAEDPNMSNADAEKFLEALAKANPRAARNPRRNPLAEPEAEKLARFAESLKRDKKVPAKIAQDAQDALAKAPDDYQQGVRKISSSKLQSYFPYVDKDDEGKQIKVDWKTETRVKEGARDADLIARVYRERRTDRIDDPFTDYADKVRPVVSKEIALTADDTAAILEAQRKKQTARRKATIPASAGLCKSFRTKRLMDYQLPIEIAAKTKKHVLIWLSPKDESKHVRVLQFRKGDHVDCDLSGPYLEEDLTSLLSRALQSNLYWLTEKPERARKVEIWVGRAGTTTLYCAYKPNIPEEYSRKKVIDISLDEITANLEDALSPGSKLSWAIPQKDGESDAAYTKRLKDIATTDLDVWAKSTENINETKKDGAKKRYVHYESAESGAAGGTGPAAGSTGQKGGSARKSKGTATSTNPALFHPGMYK